MWWVVFHLSLRKECVCVSDSDDDCWANELNGWVWNYWYWLIDINCLLFPFYWGKVCSRLIDRGRRKRHGDNSTNTLIEYISSSIWKSISILHIHHQTQNNTHTYITYCVCVALIDRTATRTHIYHIHSQRSFRFSRHPSSFQIDYR